MNGPLERTESADVDLSISFLLFGDGESSHLNLLWQLSHFSQTSSAFSLLPAQMCLSVIPFRTICNCFPWWYFCTHQMQAVFVISNLCTHCRNVPITAVSMESSYVHIHICQNSTHISPSLSLPFMLCKTKAIEFLRFLNRIYTNPSN